MPSSCRNDRRNASQKEVAGAGGTIGFRLVCEWCTETKQ